jgi:hypothetical protein
MSQITKFFRMPPASFEAAEVVLALLFGPFLGPVDENLVHEGLVYKTLKFDPETTSPAVSRETLACLYLLGQIDEEAYTPPPDVEEITLEQYQAVLPEPVE